MTMAPRHTDDDAPYPTDDFGRPVGRDSLTVTQNPDAVAFCEDCGAEIDDAGCVVWG